MTTTSEELLQTVPTRMGRYMYHRLGSTTLGQLRTSGVIKGPVPHGIRTRKPDGLITLGDGVVKAWIEYKPPSALRSRKRVVDLVDGCREPAARLCNLLIISTGTRTYWFNPHTGCEVDPNGLTLPVFNALRIVDGSASTEDLRELEEIIDRADRSLTADNNCLQEPVPLDPSTLARTLWQKIWVVTGKEAEKCLYNVAELFLFKFLSDLGVLGEEYDFGRVLRLGQRGRHVEALRYYARNSRPIISGLFPKADDNTTVINGTIFVNEQGHPNDAYALLFCSVLDDLNNYDVQNGSLRHIRREFKTRLYESFLRQSAGSKRLGQYFTPRNVVRSIVEMASVDDLPDGASLCDPFCGVGGFLLESVIESSRLMEQYEPRNGVVTPRISVVGYDKGSDEKDDERTIVLAKANAVIYISDLISKYHTSDFMGELSRKVINPMFRLVRTHVGTFGVPDVEKHDLILTNPPYVTSGSRVLKDSLEEAGFLHDYGDLGRGTEALALGWVMRALKPGGRAFVIVPDGLLNQEPVLREVKRQCVVRGVMSLPTRAFYSTPKKTYILALEKKVGRMSQQNTPVFAYRVSEIGETRDARRWALEENDLPEMAALFNQFKGAPCSFRSMSPRCRIMQWKDFDSRRHWMVDRDWEDADSDGQQVDLSEFNAMLKEIGVTPVDELDLDVPMRTVELGDTALFELFIGKRVVRRDCRNDEAVAVISANVHDVMGYIAEPRILTDFSVPSLLWGVDGDFDWALIDADYPFNPTDHCGVLRVLDSGISVEYLYYALRERRSDPGFDRVYRANLDNIKRVMVDIPVLEDGGFDLESQELMAARSREIEERRDQVRRMLRTITDARVPFV